MQKSTQYKLYNIHKTNLPLYLQFENARQNMWYIRFRIDVWLKLRQNQDEGSGFM